MDAYSAELAYLFRHALMRDAAYDLQPPSERRLLHVLVLDIVEALYPGDASALDGLALELADHAAAARAAGEQSPGLAQRECAWLERAAGHAQRNWQSVQASGLFTRLVEHPACRPEQQVQALRNLGACEMNQGKLVVAIESLRRAAKAAESLGDVALLTGTLRPLAFALRTTGQLLDACAVADRVVGMLSDSANPVAYARALDTRASVLAALHRTDEAVADAERALALARENGERELTGGVLANMALFRHSMGDSELAESEGREAIAILHEVGSPMYEASARRNLANVLRAVHRRQEAMAEAELALNIFTRIGDRRGQALALTSLGVIGVSADMSAEELARAEQRLAEAVRLLEEVGDPGRLALALANWANMLYDLDRISDALAALERAVPLAVAARELNAEGLAQENLACILARHGDLRQADVSFRACLEAYRGMGNAKREAHSHGQYGLSLLDRGEQSGAALVEHAIEMFTEQEDAREAEHYSAELSRRVEG